MEVDESKTNATCVVSAPVAAIDTRVNVSMHAAVLRMT